MNEEFPEFSFKHVFFGFLAVLFGIGTFWAGMRGGEIAFDFGKSGEKIFALSSSTKTLAQALTANIIQSDSSEEKGTSTLKIIFGGDVMLDRRIRFLGEKNGYDSLFASVTPILSKADLAVINLEGPVTSFPSKTLLSNGATTKELAFTFSPESLPALKKAGIDIVSLANNHTDNFRSEGFEQTKMNLASTGLSYFGDPWNSTSTEYKMKKNGIKVAFVGYHSFQRGFERTLASINDLFQQGYFVIVMPHWGEEYVKEPSELMKRQAELLAAAGAGAIIGGHSHIIGGSETLDGIPVYYSLGNLLFDQYFSPDVMKGLLVELTISKSKSGTKIEMIKTYNTSLSSRTHVELAK